MHRLELLDGMRGFFLVFMLLNHLPFAGGLFLAEINHGNLGYVQDAQGFVFLSGAIVGLTYMRMVERGRLADLDGKLAGRVRELYLYHATLILAVLLLVTLAPGPTAGLAPFMEELFNRPAANGIAAFMLLYQPTLMDILPQYMLYLLLAPLMLRLVAAGRSNGLLMGSLLLWLAVQLGWHLPVADGIQAWVAILMPGFVLRGHFNPFAWQILFVGGLVLGASHAQGLLDWDRWFGPGRTDLARIAGAALLAFMAYKLLTANDVIDGSLLQRFDAVSNRSEFGPVYLLNFIALAWMVTWLVVSGERTRSAVAQQLGRALKTLFQLRFLVFLGQHSLQVYAWHILVAYGLIALDHHAGPIPWLLKNLLAVAAVASLAIPAWFNARWRERTKAELAKERIAQKPAQ